MLKYNNTYNISSYTTSHKWKNHGRSLQNGSKMSELLCIDKISNYIYIERKNLLS